LICNRIVEKIKEAEYFTILSDETTDISGVEQMTLCARYVHKQDDKFVIREDFLKFIPVHDLRGISLAEVLKENIKDLGLNLANVRGLGFDGAANMSGKFNGCAAKFQESYPQAMYIHCASHSLNLALTHACTVPDIKNCLGTMNKVIVFFRSSSKRQNILKEKILDIDQSAKRTRLIKFCETRWVERLDAVSLFFDLLPIIIESLMEMQSLDDADTASQAYSYCAALQKPIFLVSIAIAFHVFNLSMGLATQLQSKQVDLRKCIQLCEDLEKELQELRKDFHTIYKEVEVLAEQIGVVLDIPRTAGRQTQRCNIQTTSAEEYYRISAFIPFIDYLINQLNERFLKHKSILTNIQILLPNVVVRASDEDLQGAINAILSQWPNDVLRSSGAFFDELKMWRRCCLSNSASEDMPGDFLSALNGCSEIVFPCVHQILKIFCSLPVTTATAERSFSTLRYLKTYLRNSMGEDRLNGLAHMFVHKNEEISVEQILDEMGKKPRRLLLL